MSLGSVCALCRQGACVGSENHGHEVDEGGQDVWMRLVCTWFGRKSAVHLVWIKV